VPSLGGGGHPTRGAAAAGRSALIQPPVGGQAVPARGGTPCLCPPPPRRGRVPATPSQARSGGRCLGAVPGGPGGAAGVRWSQAATRCRGRDGAVPLRGASGRPRPGPPALPGAPVCPAGEGRWSRPRVGCGTACDAAARPRRRQRRRGPQAAAARGRGWCGGGPLGWVGCQRGLALSRPPRRCLRWARPGAGGGPCCVRRGVSGGPAARPRRRQRRRGPQAAVARRQRGGVGQQGVRRAGGLGRWGRVSRRSLRPILRPTSGCSRRLTACAALRLSGAAEPQR
jgi:hypothetical protein